MTPPMTPAQAGSVARALALWFAKAHRDLPWRRTRDPYAIWVSEVMLQQTRVDTVQRYWGEFLRRFPTVQRLAAADESEVLAAWSGLGYYRRARLLHRGAQVVVGEWAGELPRDPQALRTVPGVGPYTAGALTAIAFDQPAALVDGNVARVMSRLDAVRDPAQQPAKAARHWPRVAAIVGAGRPRIIAQALMELGATVCTPRAPQCDGCPLRAQCRTYAADLVDTIPAPKKRRAPMQEAYWALSITWRGKLGWVHRPEHGLLAGLWCLPLVPRAELAAPTAGAVAQLVGVPVRAVRTVESTVKHVFTHRVWRLQPVTATASRKPPALPGGDAAWFGVGEHPAGGIPAVTHKLLALL